MNRQISPSLLAALSKFSEVRPSKSKTYATATLFRHDEKGADGKWSTVTWTIEEACGAALQLLDREDLALLELTYLKEQMKLHGMQGFYRHVMKKDL